MLTFREVILSELWLPTFLQIIIDNVSETIFTGVREVIIDNMVDNIVATFETLAGIFYLVVRRTMLYSIYNISII